jgi:hypothetical protein
VWRCVAEGKEEKPVQPLWWRSARSEERCGEEPATLRQPPTPHVGLAF